MPGKVKVKILSGRNLPVMDRGSLTTDAFVEIKLGNICYKTEVARKTLNPQWNSDWFRFEVDDAELQDEPLQVRVMDYDTYSANDAIGKVYINLNPLLLPNPTDTSIQKSGKVMSGWVPIFDTLQGIRGEINLMVKVDLFSDLNKFRQSSCGVQFFYSPCIPHGYTAQTIHGFVEELVVNDDPEYQWIDKIRTPRASNEARHLAFLRLSGQVQRKIGLKAIEMGANAVLGYVQNFDLEGDIGVVARGTGTAVTLVKLQELNHASSGYAENALLEDYRYKAQTTPRSADFSEPSDPFLKSQAVSSNDISLAMSSDEKSIKALLDQEDNRSIVEKSKSYGWKLRPKMFFRRAFGMDRRAKIDKISPLSRSYTDMTRSITDIRSSIDRRFRGPVADGSNMTQLLIRSVMVTPLTLDKIREHPEFPEIKVTEPMNFGSEGSDVNLSSSECTTSLSESDDEDEDTGNNTSTTQPSDFDTVSMVVKNVLEEEKKLFKNVLSEAVISAISVGKTEYETDSKGNIVDSHLVETNDDCDMPLAFLESDTDSTNWIIPGSTRDEPEIQDEPRPDFMHNIAEKLHSLQDHIHFPHLKHHHNEPSLLKTAMATMLIEQLNICEASAGITPVEVAVPEEILALPEEPEVPENLLEKIGSHIHLPHIEPDLKRIFSHGHMKLPTESLRRTQSHPEFVHFGEVPSKKPVFYNDEDDEDENDTLEFAIMPREQKSETILGDLRGRIHTISEHLQQDAHELKENLVEKMHQIQGRMHFHRQGSSEPPKEDEGVSRRYSFDAFKRRLGFSRHSESSEEAACERKLNRDSEETLKYEAGSTRVSESKSKGSDESKETLQETINETLPSSPSARPFHPRTESTSSRHTAGTPSNIINITRETGGLSLNRRSSDSDLSLTPKGNSLNSAERLNAVQRTPLMKPPMNQEALDMLEYPFLTVSKFPAGFIFHLGATVAARSVKLLERVPNPDEPETRDQWWNELRMEIRSHARTIGCNVVLAYSEVTTITDDVCVLSATGTAAVVNFNYVGDMQFDVPGSSRANKEVSGTSLEKREDMTAGGAKRKERKTSESDAEVGEDGKDFRNTPPPQTQASSNAHAQFPCSICHVPYASSSLPFKALMSKCGICRRYKVPDVLLATIELPENIQVTGKGCLIQAHVIRNKRDLKTEANAKEISDGLPFLEYELHRQLIAKLKVKGMNAIFGLKSSLAVGERVMALVATGTGVFLSALPPPKVPKIVAGNSWTDLEKLGELQKTIQDTMEKNRELYQLKAVSDSNANGKTSDTEDSEDELAELDLTLGNRDTCLLEVDDIHDLEVIALLMETNPPEGFHVVNIQSVPGIQDLDYIKHLQMFTQVWRAKISLTQPNINFSKHFQRILQTIYFKLRTMIPCAISGLKFLLDLPEADEMQILVTGMAYGLGEPGGKTSKFKKRMIVHSVSKDGSRRLDDDLIFNLEEDVDSEAPANLLHTGSLRLRKKSPTRGKNKIARHVPLRERYGVDITPLFGLPGGQIEKYLGNLNFFFIRESTAIRENGGISGFIHSFITELLAVVRAHVTALGGNAIVSFHMTELMLVDNPHKNQGQCLINVGGDVVFVSDFLDE